MLIEDLAFIEASSSEIQGGWRRFRRPRRFPFRPRLKRRGWGSDYNLHPLIQVNLNFNINIQIVNIDITQVAFADNGAKISQFTGVDVSLSK